MGGPDDAPETDATEVETSDNQSDGDTNEDSEEQSSEDSSSEPVEQIIGVKDVPEQLQPIAKRMLAGYTKSMQAIKAQAKELEEHLGTKFAQHITRSKALDSLANNANFQLLMADLEGNRPYGYSSVYNKNDARGSSDEGESESDSKVNSKDMASIIQKEVNKALKPFIDQQARSTYENAKSNLKNFGKYQADITDILTQFPNMPIKMAYDLASMEDRVSEAKQSANGKLEEDIKTLKNKPRTEKGSSARSDTLAPVTKKTIREAIDYAMSKQGG